MYGFDTLQKMLYKVLLDVLIMAHFVANDLEFQMMATKHCTFLLVVVLTGKLF